MTERVAVAESDELEHGERKIVSIDGESIGVFNFEGEHYAALNTCRHEGGPACEGNFRGALVGEFEEPGKRVNEQFSDTPAISCPWHGWEYDLTTGEHLGDPEVVLPTYEVVEEDGTLYIQM
jgi:nitrite reductase/ring-hydroxylating ferredoxin subunit